MNSSSWDMVELRFIAVKLYLEAAIVYLNRLKNTYQSTIDFYKSLEVKSATEIKR